MREYSRRKFLKKNALGGLCLGAGIQLGANKGLFAQEHLNFQDKHYDEVNWDAIREEFIFPKTFNYLNTASLGPSPKVVVNAIYESMLSLEEKCSHGHHLAKRMHQKLAELLNVDENEIAITRNATEGMNIIAQSLKLKIGDEVIITTHEHVGGAAPWLALKKELGIRIVLVDLDETGQENLRRIQQRITKQTKAIVVSHITCTTGMRLPVKEIATLCRENNIYSCIDGAQSLGMISIDLNDINPDFYTGSGHKWLCGPKGTGFLYTKKELLEKLSPVFVGAYSDSSYDLNKLELTYRNSAQREEYGTRNTPTIIGLGSAIDFIKTIGTEHIESRGNKLCEYLRKELIKKKKIEVITPEDKKWNSSILTFRIRGINNLEFNKELNTKHGIRLRGIYENNLNALRVSCAFFNTYKELDELIKVIDI